MPNSTSFHTYFSLTPGWQHWLYIHFFFFFPYVPLRDALIFHPFLSAFLFAQLLLRCICGSSAFFSLRFLIRCHISTYVHHSWRWLRQKKGSAVCPVGFQGPAESRGSLFVRKWFSRCWGGHSKSSLAISVMALRRCCLCPVMVTDDWLGRRGPSRRFAMGRTNRHTHTHKHLHKMPLHWRPMWLRVIVSSQAVVLVVILNDHSQRGVLTICPFKGKMIPLYRLTPEHLTTTATATKASTNRSAGTIQLLMLAH